ncbi:MAG: META domain-containing protein [Patescibacteria group bacterium]
MKKILIIAIMPIIIVIVLIIALGIYKFNFTNDDIYIDKGGKIDSKDATYIINGEQITLKDGLAESVITSDSSSKIITRYFGNDAIGDLNQDGLDDTAFLLTQDNGGSGTFYYLTVAIANKDGHQGLNAVLLGDRIAPQTTSIKDGQIIVNYADRKIDESFVVEPSVGVSKFFKVIDGQLKEISNPLITEREWMWVETKMNNDKIITPKQSDSFVINFKNDNVVSGSTDCNRFFGRYEMSDGKLTLVEPLAMTEMYCVDSQESIFVDFLGEVESYFINKDNKLVLQLKMDTGVMIFK